MDKSRILTHYGGALKIDESGRVSGLLVRFSSEDDTDLEQDFFDADTDYDLDEGGTKRVTMYYHHGMNPVVGQTPIGSGTVKITSEGVFLEGELAVREDYERFLAERLEGGSKALFSVMKTLADKGKLGLSSGTAAHLVSVQPIYNADGSLKARRIMRWPLGPDASPTPTPAEPKTTLSIKTLSELSRVPDPLLQATTGDDAPEKETKTDSAEASRPDAVAAVGSEAGVSTPRPVAVSTLVSPPAKTADTMAEDNTTLQAPGGDGAATPPDDAAIEDAVKRYLARKADEEEAAAEAARQAQAAQNATMDEHAEAIIKAYLAQTKTTDTPFDAPPAVKRTTRRGFSDEKDLAFKYYYQTGDAGPLVSIGIASKHTFGDDDAFKDLPGKSAQLGNLPIVTIKAHKASNDTDMNIGTAADGGDLVPTGHFDRIVRKREESSIVDRLGLMPIPGVGTTVDVPYDNEDDGEFVSTAEAANFDRDAPAVAKKSSTLVKYTKRIEISYELLEDEESGLMPFLEAKVGTGWGKTENNNVLTEVASNGTSLKTFAATGAIAAGELEDMVYNTDLAYYLDDAGTNVSWVMRPPTYGDLISLRGNDRIYGGAAIGPRGATVNRAPLLEYPVFFTNKAAAMAASAKSVYFGNWFYVGFRRSPNMQFLRDPYTLSISGQIRLLYYVRSDEVVIQAKAIGYGIHASS